MQSAATTAPDGATQLPQPSSHIQAQTQRIVMIKHGLQRSDQMILAHSRRNLQQHRWLNRSIRPPRSSSQRMIGVATTPQWQCRQWCRRLLDQRRDASQPATV